MTIRDNKVPYIFLAGGDHGDDQEPVGRTIFTLALMTVLVARRIFAPMTWDGGSAETDPGREYDIAGVMLKIGRASCRERVQIPEAAGAAMRAKPRSRKLSGA